MKIDWLSNESHVFLNPKALTLHNLSLNKVIKDYSLESHIILATSGSTALNSSEMKFVALSKNAILNSSKSVNDHLDCTKNDILLNALPYFHIGGLSLYSRSYLSGAKLINVYSDSLKWDANYFIQEIIKNKVTIASLVPTQIYDLINQNLTSPPSLRAVVVGGGALSKSLYDKAKKLNWPLLPSYGMTECASQIATAAINFKWETTYPELKILDHLNVKKNEYGNLSISGSSLLTGYIILKNNETQFLDVKTHISNESDKYLITSDIGNIKDSFLQIYGRNDDVVKVSGENVSLSRLDHILLDLKTELEYNDDAAVIYEKDERLENKISLVFTKDNIKSSKLFDQIKNEFNKRVFPFEKIKNIYFIDKIPRTELGKLKRNQLICDLSKNNHQL